MQTPEELDGKPLVGKTVGIMQPTFLPWAGYFAMVDSCDVFVFLDDVALSHRSWQHRNRIGSSQGPIWVTLPLLTKGRRGQRIIDAEVMMEGSPLRKILGTIRHSYATAPGFSIVFPELERLLEEYLPMGLAKINIELINLFSSWLSIETAFYRSSELEVSSSEKTSRLAAICKQFGASDYLAAAGSRDYIEADGRDLWGETSVHYFDYAHPRWNQRGPGQFEPFLSVIDLFMNDFSNAPAIMRSGLHTRNTANLSS